MIFTFVMALSIEVFVVIVATEALPFRPHLIWPFPLLFVQPLLLLLKFVTVTTNEPLVAVNELVYEPLSAL